MTDIDTSAARAAVAPSGVPLAEWQRTTDLADAVDALRRELEQERTATTIARQERDAEVTARFAVIKERDDERETRAVWEQLATERGERLAQARAQRDAANAQAARLAAMPLVVLARTWTPDETNGSTTTVRVKRSCNGCGCSVGDVTAEEIDDVFAGRQADVRSDCVFCLRAALDAANKALAQIPPQGVLCGPVTPEAALGAAGVVIETVTGERDRARAMAAAVEAENGILRIELLKTEGGDLAVRRADKARAETLEPDPDPWAQVAQLRAALERNALDEPATDAEVTTTVDEGSYALGCMGYQAIAFAALWATDQSATERWMAGQ